MGGWVGARRTCVLDRPRWIAGYNGPMTASRLLGLLPQVLLLAAVTALAFLSGGYIFSRTAPVALALVLGALVVLWARRPRERLPLPYAAGLVALAAYAVWTGVSVLWSVGPDLSWLSFDVTLMCLGVAWIAAVVRVGRLQLRVVGYGYVAVATAVAVYAILGKVVPEVVTHAHTYARLSEPVGYWNVLAVTMVFGAVLALEAAARRELSPPLRGVAAGALLVLFFTLFFSFSRGGVLACLLGLLVFFLLSNRRLSAAFTLALVLGTTGAVLWHVRHLTTLFNPTTDDALRTEQGHTLGRWVVVALVVVIVVQLGAALVQRRLRLGPRPRLALGSVVIAVLIGGIIVGGSVYFPRHGGLRSWVRTHYEAVINDTGAQGAGASRLLAFGTNGRLELYREVLRGAPGHRLLGTGAGTFRFTHLEERRDSGVVMHAHSEWFNVYSELGAVGLALFVVAIAGLLVAGFARLFKDRSDPDRALLAALQAAMVAFVFHISIDWDWGMLSATLAFLLFAGTAAGYLRARKAAERAAAEAGVWAAAEEPVGTEAGAGAEAAPDRRAGEGAGPRRPARRLSPGACVLASALLALGVVSWALPYLSQRAYAAALKDAGRERVAAAVSAAERAHRLDPLAVDPLIALAQLQQRQGKGTEAKATLERALRLQPRNFEVYYQLGLLELNTFDSKAEAAAWFRKALVLNPQDAAIRFQLSLAEGG
jgi:tetratricopeptide (TPR) repeat protein